MFKPGDVVKWIGESSYCIGRPLILKGDKRVVISIVENRCMLSGDESDSGGCFGWCDTADIVLV